MSNDESGSNDESYKLVGRVSTESVFKATGKHWVKWIELLDKAGARSWTHAEIVAYLKKKYRLGPWWQQGVTLGFELAIGRRIEGQNLKGQYTTTITKSFTVSVAKLWTYLVSAAGQAIWFQPLSPVEIKAGAQFETQDGFYGEIRTLKKKPAYPNDVAGSQLGKENSGAAHSCLESQRQVDAGYRPSRDCSF